MLDAWQVGAVLASASIVTTCVCVALSPELGPWACQVNVASPSSGPALRNRDCPLPESVPCAGCESIT